MYDFVYLFAFEGVGIESVTLAMDQIRTKKFWNPKVAGINKSANLFTNTNRQKGTYDEEQLKEGHSQLDMSFPLKVLYDCLLYNDYLDDQNKLLFYNISI